MPPVPAVFPTLTRAGGGSGFCRALNQGVKSSKHDKLTKTTSFGGHPLNDGWSVSGALGCKRAAALSGSATASPPVDTAASNAVLLDTLIAQPLTPTRSPETDYPVPAKPKG